MSIFLLLVTITIQYFKIKFFPLGYHFLSFNIIKKNEWRVRPALRAGPLPTSKHTHTLQCIANKPKLNHCLPAHFLAQLEATHTSPNNSNFPALAWDKQKQDKGYFLSLRMGFWPEMDVVYDTRCGSIVVWKFSEWRLVQCLVSSSYWSQNGIKPGMRRIAISACKNRRKEIQILDL